MATPTSTAMPKPIGSIPKPIDRVEQIAKNDSRDPSIDPFYLSLAPFYEDAFLGTIETPEATGPPVVTNGMQKKYYRQLWIRVFQR